MLEPARREETARVSRGGRRWLAAQGFEALTEFRPAKSLRADLFGIGPAGEIWILEVKSCPEDFRADQKWRGYRDWCDRFFFCVGPGFPLEILPEEAGLVQADGFEGALLRPSPLEPLAPARRKALLQKAARDAAARLRRLEDPEAGF